MQKNKMIRYFLICLSATMGLLSWAACNKGFERVIKQEGYADTTSATEDNPKVLFIMIDGARGQSVRDAEPSNIMSLTSNAIYCWNVVTDTLIADYTTWADLLTGVHKEKHNILGKTLDGNDLSTYPVFFKHIKDRYPNLRIAAYSSSDSLGKLISDADVNKVFNDNDASTEEAALNEMKVDSTGLVMVQFKSVDKAGIQYGYDLSVPQYKAAIMNVDNYIGKLLTAMKARKNYANEGWMVVVASNHGGPFTIPSTEDDHTILSNPSVNGFIIFSTPKYVSSFIDKPYTGARYIGAGVELQGHDTTTAVRAVAQDANGFYNPGDTSQLTVELKVKVMPGDNGDYSYTNASILAKRASLDTGAVGWAVSLNQKSWRLSIGQTGIDNFSVDGGTIGDGNWHDIAAVIEINGKSKHVKTFTDGNQNNDVTNASLGGAGLNTDVPLTLGFLPSDGEVPPPDVMITEVKIWDTLVDNGTIGQYACETSLPGNHPYSNKLIGYWPVKDGQGAVLKDESTIGQNFVLQNNYAWTSFNDLVCPANPGDISSVMPQPVDVCRQIMDWLQVPADVNWSLDGRVWTTNYVGLKN